MKTVNSIQELIERFFLINENKNLFFVRKGYRTKSITCRELKEYVIKVRIFLKKEGLKKSDKLILFGQNSIEWIIVYFACVLSGIIVVPLDVQSNKNFLDKVQKQTKAKLVFQNKNLPFISIKKFYLENIDRIIKSTKLLSISNVKSSPNDIIEIIYTSGTTGEPKGVVLTNKNLTTALNSLAELFKTRIKLKVLNLVPLSHIFGQMTGLLLLMYCGHKIFFLDTIIPRKVISFIRVKNINFVILVPSILASLKEELEGKSTLLNLGVQFRFVGVGGASLDVSLEKWWRKRLIRVIQGYGLTETSAIISSNTFLHSKTGSVGRPVKIVSIKFEKDGEILVKGDNVTPGYYLNKQKTKESFKNGWFKTGDIGFIKKNYLYLKSRKKDVIVLKSGMNVYPSAIESILNKQAGVKESCVVEKNGKVHAVLLLNKKINVNEVIERVNKKLISYQKISGYTVWPQNDFPRSITGKVKKYVVAEEIKKIKSITNKYYYKSKLYNIINDVLEPREKIKPESKLTTLGMDSLKRIELISKIEKEFGVEIAESKLDYNSRVVDLMFLKKLKVKRVKFKKWPMNFFSRVVRFLAQKVFLFLINFFTKTEYYGLENLKSIKTPVIFACNHQSVLDLPVVLKKLKVKTAAAAESKYVFGIGVEDSFFLKLYRKFTGYFSMLFFNAYPFGESIGVSTSLEFTGEMLDRGYSIIIFPEGQRTTDGKIKTFKLGVGYLALKMAVSVVPVRIKGLFEVLPPGKFIPKFHNSKVKFGKPIFFKNVSYIDAVKKIEEEVKKL